MTDIFAQGDLLIERVRDVPTSGRIIEPTAEGVFVLAEGELTGHRHVVCDPITMFRDDALARDMPSDLYVGHIKVSDAPVYIEHDEHAPIMLDKGTYRVRRQRELEPEDARRVSD